MPSVNKVILIGNLTRDPQSRQLPTNSTVAEFGLAMNRKFKSADGEDREEVCFVDCSAFGRQAEVIQKYSRKGKSLYIEGRLRYDTWDDKNGHGKRSKISVIVDNFQFLGGKDDPDHGEGEPAHRGNEDRKNARGNWEGANLPARAAKGKPQQPFGEQMAFKEADIPF